MKKRISKAAKAKNKRRATPSRKKEVDRISLILAEIRVVQEQNERHEKVIQMCQSAVEEARQYAAFIERYLLRTYEDLPKQKRVPLSILCDRFNAEKDGISVDTTEFDFIT